MKKILIVIFIILLLLIGIGYYFYYKGDIKIIPGDSGILNENSPINPNFGNSQDLNRNNNSNKTLNANNTDFTSEEISQNDDKVEDVILPNFQEYDCGFYFQEYGVCGGKCPAGVCTPEGRSCYCKIL
jgi:hypothetical protein